MTKPILFLFGFFIIWGNGWTFLVRDDAGHHFNVDKPYQQIISLSPDITEILFAIHAEKQLLGVIEGSDFPLTARKMTRVGSYSGLDMEKIISLHPDLIIAWEGTFYKQLAMLEALGFRVFRVHPKNITDVPNNAIKLGYLTGNTAYAVKLYHQFLFDLKQLELTYKNAKPVSVFYQIGKESLFTVNENSWINQAISFCGGRNIFAKVKMIAPEISFEALFVLNPEVILQSSKEMSDRWQVTTQLKAVEKKTIYTIYPDWIERAGPRLILGVRQICERLQSARSILKNS